MAQPPKYTPAYDFTQDAGNQTNHTALNQELAALKQTLDATLNNLALIQNDQGGATAALVNSIRNQIPANAGSLTFGDLGQPNGPASLDATGKLVQMPTAADVGAEPANPNIQAHIANTNNPHSVTAAQIGAVSKAGDTMTGALTLAADPANALEAATKQYVDNNYQPVSQKGVANGYAALDANGEVVQLPAGAAANPTKVKRGDGTWVDVGGGSSMPVVAVTAAYTVTSGDAGKLLNCTGGTYTVTLLAPATAGDGFVLAVRNESTTATDIVTVTDGTFVKKVPTGAAIYITCDGSTYHVVAQSGYEFGESQTWKDVTGSKSPDTIYTNNTGRSIAVAAHGQNANSVFSVHDPATGIPYGIEDASDAGNVWLRTFAIVPPGAQYRVGHPTSPTLFPTTIGKWAELS